ncbi:hypothetical protein FB451DRAFT_152870 [Mycena latifolia]|nr:hypothetical protein FB451DRAFT_152870 [Mycena latifolia]
MSRDDLVHKSRRLIDISEFPHLVARIVHWFRLGSWPHENQSESEEASNVSPQHAQTEDASAKFWSVYISEAERYDSALVESWKADMEGMLIFSGLFSASLTAFIIESYKNLVPDTGDMTVALLSQLSQQLNAQFNGSQLPISPPAPFKVQTSSLICNGFWFVSLGLSLTCALLATLVEQWAREFIHKTEIRPSPVRRARVFSFLYYGVSRFGIHAIVDIVPLLLHIALVLFFAGLAAFLLPINNLMAGLVSCILAAFLAFYTAITILPAISMDCPYRTPLSGICWRFLQSLSILIGLPSTNRSLTDAILSAAMKRRDIRDQRAVLWTLDSLTDNTELLPFVEAIHDIVHGPAGFRRVDDHLFRLVLQTADSHTSLPSRILALLWSAEALPRDDPLRHRRQTEGLRAIWALGFVAARVSSAPAKAVYGIDENSLRALAIPDSYRITLEAVIEYVHLRNIKTRFEEIGAMLWLRDVSTARERKRLIRFLRSRASGLDADVRERKLRAPEITSALAIVVQISKSDPDDAGNYKDLTVARRIVRDLNSDQLWAFHLAQIVVRLLRESFWGGVVPYMLLATCEEILPEIPTLPDHLRHSQSVLPGGAEHLPMSLHSLIREGSQNDLDVLMRCSLRLLPLLDPPNFMPTIHWYLANRGLGGDAFGYAFADCNLDILAAYILHDIRARPGISDTLCGISTLCLWRKHFTRLLDCETIYSVVEANTQSHSSPAYLTFKAILSSSMLSFAATTLMGCKMKYEQSGRDAQNAESILGVLHEVASHPLLRAAGNAFTASEGVGTSSVTEPLGRMLSEICDQYAAIVTGLLSACVSPIQLPYRAEATVKYLCREWHPFFMRSMTAERQLEFAHAALKLVECACDSNNPHRAAVAPVVRGLWEYLDYKLHEIVRDPSSVLVINQALSLYRTSSDADGTNPILPDLLVLPPEGTQSKIPAVSDLEPGRK